MRAGAKRVTPGGYDRAMSTTPGSDQRPWDLRLVEWMSRDSYPAARRGPVGLVWLATWTVAYWVLAAIDGGPIAFAGAGVLTVIVAARVARTLRARRGAAG